MIIHFVNFDYMSKKKKGTSETYRRFSIEAKKAIVKEIDKGLSKLEASRKYSVSPTTIYNWLDLYSSKFTKPKKVIVQSTDESDSYLRQKAKIDQLYNLLGRSQTEVLFLKQPIELASEEIGIDLKKSFASQLSDLSSHKKQI